LRKEKSNDLVFDSTNRRIIEKKKRFRKIGVTNIRNNEALGKNKLI